MPAEIPMRREPPRTTSREGVARASAAPNTETTRPERGRTVLRERFFGDAARREASRVTGSQGLPCDAIGAVEVAEVWISAEAGPQPCDLRLYNHGGTLLGSFRI